MKWNFWFFKPWREKGWTNEGILYRKGHAVILKPTVKQKKYRVRIAEGKMGKPFEAGECDCMTRKMAFREGNKLAKTLSNKP
jgi:hypothetical protein